MSFDSLNLHKKISESLNNRGFSKPTLIQEKAIPILMRGKDLIACAKTGSGKTLAFLLPVFDRILLGKSTKRVLCLVPTRELAQQIGKEAEELAKITNENIAIIYGGVDYEKQRKLLAKNPKLIVATPGRLLDYVKQKEIHLNEFTDLILDEADRMLDMGFIDDIRRIIAKTPQDRRVALFSATLDYQAIYSIWEYMREPEEILINPELIDHTKIKQNIIHLGRSEKIGYLIQMLDDWNYDPVIIFVNTKAFVKNLENNLLYHNISARGLSSIISQKKRNKILEDFRDHKFRVLIATDVASRGIHVEDVELIINYDIPQDPESYVHRIGRTARAGKEGRAVSICSEIDYENLFRLQKYLQYDLPIMQPKEKFLESLSFVKVFQDSKMESNHRKRNLDVRSSGRVSKKNKGETLSYDKSSKSKNIKKKKQLSYSQMKHKVSPLNQNKTKETRSTVDKRTKDLSGIQKKSESSQIRILKQEKTFWQKIKFWKKEKPVISAKTLSLLKKEREEINSRIPNSKKQNQRKK